MAISICFRSRQWPGHPVPGDQEAGRYGTALDACLICGADGYRQEGQNVICRRCASAIYIPSIGQKGGCNPIGFASHVDGDTIVIDASALSQSRGGGTEVGKSRRLGSCAAQLRGSGGRSF